MFTNARPWRRRALLNSREIEMRHTYNHCRFCKKYEIDGNDRLVKYGVRHYAHYVCYLDAGKSLTDLSAWQIGAFPYRLLKERGLDAYAEARIENEKRDGIAREEARVRANVMKLVGEIHR